MRCFIVVFLTASERGKILVREDTKAQQLLKIRRKQLFGKSMTSECAIVFPALQ
jgi:hypothetical protein